MNEQPPSNVHRLRPKRPPQPSLSPDDWHAALQRTSRGQPQSCPANIALIVEHTPQYNALRLNTFTNCIETGPPVLDALGRPVSVPTWQKQDNLRLARFLATEYHMAVNSLSLIATTMDAFMESRSYCPLMAWLDALPPWDEIDRLCHFFPTFCHTPATPLHDWLGISLFVSLVARAYQPGCKVDTMIVLQGAQGIGKTQLCKVIGGPWYRPLIISFESKDLLIALRNTWLAELAELDSLSRAGQARIKAMLTTTVDIYRPPYEHTEISQDRRTVFIGTTNDNTFLFDETGVRRFYPIETGEITLEGLQDSIQDLFAEAISRYRAHVHWWNDNPEVEAEANENRELVQDVHPWLPLISAYCDQYPNDITLDNIYSGLCLNLTPEKRTRHTSTTIGIQLSKLGIRKQRGTKSSNNKPFYRKL